MASKAIVEAFANQRVFALAGASRSGRKFGNAVLKELSEKGHTVYPVHPQAADVNGHRAYPSLAALPEPVGGLIVVVPPAQSAALVREAHQAGITRIWLQQGAESPEAIRYCQEHSLDVVHGECILMFAEPAKWFHRAHRWIWKVTGKLPS